MKNQDRHQIRPSAVLMHLQEADPHPHAAQAQTVDEEREDDAVGLNFVLWSHIRTMVSGIQAVWCFWYLVPSLFNVCFTPRHSCSCFVTVLVRENMSREKNDFRLNRC